MTAIVGILNRNGVAFAADSAATHTLATDNKKKITNHANKVFELSRYKPVGVAICGNLSFMGMPWEDAFKMYRSQLEKNSFAHITDYVFDFMRYVRTTILPYFNEEQKSCLSILCNGLKYEMVNVAVEQIKKQGKTEQIWSEDLFPLMIKQLEAFINTYSTESMRNGKDYEGYSLQKFKKYAEPIVESIMGKVFKSDKCPKNFKDLFYMALFNILVSVVHVYLPTTEIIFWGYGDEDLFPKCHSIIISAAFDGRIKWTDKTDFTISKTSPAWIIPYAQTDVANTVVRGVDQSLRDYFGTKTNEVISKLKNDLAQKMVDIGAPQDFKDALLSFDVDPYMELFKTDMEKYIRENYINKLMDTVSYLMKEDLADMAESLVRMTCLKRHFTTDDETVGGPVDVAVITKGDGFVWIKRKHYFSPEINYHYFERQ